MDGVKILLVEDESIEALDIKRTLESFGYNIPYVASTGEEAVEKAREIIPDLILMDIILKEIPMVSKRLSRSKISTYPLYILLLILKRLLSRSFENRTLWLCFKTI
jgi:CheY-like chemotaxis protein